MNSFWMICQNVWLPVFWMRRYTSQSDFRSRWGRNDDKTDQDEGADEVCADSLAEGDDTDDEDDDDGVAAAGEVVGVAAAASGGVEGGKAPLVGFGVGIMGCLVVSTLGVAIVGCSDGGNSCSVGWSSAADVDDDGAIDGIPLLPSLPPLVATGGSLRAAPPLPASPTPR